MIKVLDLLILVFASIGMSYILTNSVLLKEPRELISNWLYKKSTRNLDQLKKKSLVEILYSKLDYLITCIVCCSVWTSALLYIFSYYSSLLQLEFNYYDLLLIICITPAATIYYWNTLASEEEEE